jgi:hypothetical protein
VFISDAPIRRAVASRRKVISRSEDDTSESIDAGAVSGVPLSNSGSGA